MPLGKKNSRSTLANISFACVWRKSEQIWIILYYWIWEISKCEWLMLKTKEFYVYIFTNDSFVAILFLYVIKYLLNPELRLLFPYLDFFFSLLYVALIFTNMVIFMSNTELRCHA
jgi:hypothetical protein